MKIAIEAQRIFRPNKHGMDFVALETIRELQKMDHENEYFIFISPGEDRCLESSDNVHIIELKCPTYPLWEQMALPRAVKSIKPDLLHCTSNTAPLHCPVPLVLTLHDIIYLEKRQSSSLSLVSGNGVALSSARRPPYTSQMQKDYHCLTIRTKADSRSVTLTRRTITSCVQWLQQSLPSTTESS